mgnify:CR=1 FL=1
MPRALKPAGKPCRWSSLEKSVAGIGTIIADDGTGVMDGSGALMIVVDRAKDARTVVEVRAGLKDAEATHARSRDGTSRDGTSRDGTSRDGTSRREQPKERRALLSPDVKGYGLRDAMKDAGMIGVVIHRVLKNAGIQPVRKGLETNAGTRPLRRGLETNARKKAASKVAGMIGAGTSAARGTTDGRGTGSRVRRLEKHVVTRVKAVATIVVASRREPKSPGVRSPGVRKPGVLQRRSWTRWLPSQQQTTLI